MPILMIEMFHDHLYTEVSCVLSSSQTSPVVTWWIALHWEHLWAACRASISPCVATQLLVYHPASLHNKLSTNKFPSGMFEGVLSFINRICRPKSNGLFKREKDLLPARTSQDSMWLNKWNTVLDYCLGVRCTPCRNLVASNKIILRNTLWPDLEIRRENDYNGTSRWLKVIKRIAWKVLITKVARFSILFLSLAKCF